MPKYRSIDGRWVPVSTTAKEECAALGVTSLGGGKPKADLSIDAAIDERDGKEMTPERKEMKKRLNKKRGMFSKKKKRKVF